MIAAKSSGSASRQVRHRPWPRFDQAKLRPSTQRPFPGSLVQSLQFGAVQIVRATTHDTTQFQYGHVFKVHSEEELAEFVKTHSDRTVVLECKSTTCKPCMKFKHTYTMIATRFEDSAFLEVYGDETPELRKLMGTWKIRTTPAFRIYRGGTLVTTIVGAKKDKLVDEILAGLSPEHRGRDWVEPDVLIDSDSDSDED